MSEIPFNITAYKNDIKTAAREFIDSFDILCHTPVASTGDRANKTPFTMKKGSKINRLKFHSVGHSSECIGQFTTMLHTQSERGEHHNGKNRKAAYHSNHRNLSNDIARYFATEYMHLSIAEGSVWDDGSKKCGSRVEVTANSEMLKNCIRRTKKISLINFNEFTKGYTAIFCYKLSKGKCEYFIGKVDTLSNKTGDKFISVIVYDFEIEEEYTSPFDPGDVSTLKCSKKHVSVNPLLYRQEGEPKKFDQQYLDRLSILDKVDLFQDCTENNRKFFILNECKFGTFFVLKNYNSRFVPISRS